MIRNKITLKIAFVLLALFFLLSGGSRFERNQRMHFNSSFRPDQVAQTHKILIKFEDSVPDDTLTVYFEPMNLPVAFSRNIHTAVCSDTVCRLVNLTMYWEVAGKYLGYSVPGNEELTKKDHVPFLESDYTRLGEILADSSSLLGLYTPEEISPVKADVAKTDGITGATIPDLSPWIVPDAAYTSYTLWHLTYGSTRDSILAYTGRHLLSTPLLIHLLQDSDPYNQIKAFQWIRESNIDRNQFIEEALEVLHNGNYEVFGSALDFLRKCIDKERLQLQVVTLLGHDDFQIGIRVVDYLRESEKFSRPVALELLTFLQRDNYYLVNTVLALLEKRYVFEQNDLLKISTLLKSKNKKIANRAYYFLLSRNFNNQHLTSQLNEYSKGDLKP